MGIFSSFSFGTDFLEVMGFWEASPSLISHNPAQTTSRGGSRLSAQKAAENNCQREGKALDEAEFRGDTIRAWVPGLLHSPSPSCKWQLRTEAAEPGVWAEFSSHNYTVDVWGRATVSAEGGSFCSCTKNTSSSNMLIARLLLSNNIEERLRKGHTMPTHLANSVMRPINLDGLSIKHQPPQRTKLTRCLSFCWPIPA